ncbi:MAG: RagB/SusD family nutrient uptake outer membrane protein [Gemmatimonadetes bacterium]|nr:MAG: RagB/SusD family nutrient uptake outer membrane protein [Gemmatimonadota bacterium]
MRTPLRTPQLPKFPLVAVVCCLAFAACQEITVPNYNTPNAEALLNTPNATTVNTTVQGLQAGMRAQVGTMATVLGILGREVYNLDGAEPRNVLGYLVGPLEPGGFGTDMGWTTSYRNLRTAVSILAAVDKVPTYTTEQRNGIRGFVKTAMAMEFMNQLRIRDTFGIVVEVGADPMVLQPFVSRDSGWARAASLLDEAATNLGAAGSAFPFRLTTGYTGFNTPANYLKVNRAIKARVDVYRDRWADALTDLGGSFISTASTTASALSVGAYHVYSTSSGDALNPLFDASPRALVAVPSFLTEAQFQADGATRDRRATSKAAVGTVLLSTQSVSSNVKITLYASNVASVPMIKNEELILLRAEANYRLGNRVAAIQDLNFIRVNSGGLAPLPADHSGDLVTELLYNRRYSLFDEYGHRWVDMRRYGRLNLLEKALPSHKIFPLVPIVVDECNQRLAAPPKGCTQVSGQ